MDQQPGIWWKALDVCLRNWGPVALYVGLMMAFGLAQDYMSSSTGLSFAQAMAAAALAIPAHLSVLKNIGGREGMKFFNNNKILMPFVFRGFGLGLLALAIPFVVFIVLLVNGDPKTNASLGLALIVAGIIAALFSAYVFAKWGTMLPAIVVGDDKSLAEAGLRGSRSFGYAFPRLLISFGLLTAVMIAVVLSINHFSVGDGKFFPDGKIDFAAIASALIGNVIGAYQIAMTAVILSRAYLKAEETTAASVQ